MNVPFRNLPPLHFLPAFEAAGRLGSFKAAAAELHVTPSAISQQLKAIEEELGTTLFERRARAIRLTAAGAIYLSEIQRSLAEIAAASRRMRQRTSGRTLRLSTADFIAYEFILPRLSAFRTRFPGVTLSLEASTHLVDFGSSDIDAAIRIGGGSWPGMVSQEIGEAYLTPVCSKDLARTIRDMAQLCDHPLIEMRGQEQRGWKAFMRKRSLREPRQLLMFESYVETLRAAEQGLGIAFGMFPLTNEWVGNGRLIAPLPLRIPYRDKIYFVYRKTDARDTLYDSLAVWLREEYRALPVRPKHARIARRPK